MNILDYISADRIHFFYDEKQEDILKKLVSLSEEKLHDVESFYQSILKREELMSTGIGHKIAFPHEKTKDVREFFITIGVSTHGVDWKSFDNKDVNLIFLIGGLYGQQEQYLKLLAQLSSLIKKEENREKLLNSRSPKDFQLALKSLV